MINNIRPPIKQISENVIRILGQNPGSFTLDGTNTYLIGNGNQRLLIDAGQNIPEYKDLLLQVLKDTKSEISQVILTHSHPDHSLGLEQILQIKPDIQISKYGYLDQDKDLEQKLKFKYNILQDKDIVKFQNFTFQVFKTTGHCSDHCCYFQLPEKILYTGDFVLSGSSNVITDLDAQFQSIDEALLFQAEMLFAGHGPEIIGKQLVEEEIIKNKKHRQTREQQLLDALQQVNSEEKNLDQLQKLIYPDLKDENLILGAKNNITINLKRLIKNKIVQCNGDPNFDFMNVNKSQIDSLNFKLI